MHKALEQISFFKLITYATFARVLVFALIAAPLTVHAANPSTPDVYCQRFGSLDWAPARITPAPKSEATQKDYDAALELFLKMYFEELFLDKLIVQDWLKGEATFGSDCFEKKEGVDIPYRSDYFFKSSLPTIFISKTSIELGFNKPVALNSLRANLSESTSGACISHKTLSSRLGSSGLQAEVLRNGFLEKVPEWRWTKPANSDLSLSKMISARVDPKTDCVTGFFFKFITNN